MIQDLVYTELKTYRKLIEDYAFEERDENSFSWTEMYPLGFEFPLTPLMDNFAMGQSSGMIALSRRMIGIGKSKPLIQLYDSKSKPINKIYVNAYASECFLHICPNDDLIVVTDNGDIITYTAFKETKRYSINSFYPNCTIMKAGFYEDGVVCALTDGNVIDVYQYDTPVIMQHFNDFGRPSVIVAIPRTKSITNSTLVMMCEKGHLFVFDENRYYEMEYPQPAISVAASDNYEKIAILLEDFTLIVANQALDSIIYQTKVDDNSMTDFQMMEWIGDAVPAISLNGAVVLGTEDYNSPVFFVDDIPVIFHECDSIYVITQSQSYRLSAIPDNVATVLDKNATSDGGTLCRVFDNRLTEPFVEKLSEIQDISAAITDLIDTAEYVTDKNAQIFFVAAACFANAYSNRGRGNIIGKVNERLRIMNALAEIGMPITAKQLDNLETSALFSRLCHRGMHKLAFEIARFMKYPISAIGDDLVMAVIDTTKDDSAVISQLPLEYIRPSFAAEYAIRKHRISLAIMFSELETDQSKKCLLFAQMEQWEPALTAAAETCDLSCLLGVVRTAIASSQINVVNSAIANCESAIHLLMKIPSLTTAERLGDILEKIPPTLPQADVLKIYQLFQSDFTMTIEPCTSLKKLRDIQFQIIEKTGDKSIDKMSLNSTIRTLLLKDRKEELKFLVKKMGVDSKRLASLKMHAFSSNKKWAALKHFGAKKKRRDMWPQIIMIFKKENEKLAREFIDEIGTLDQKAKAQFLSELQAGNLLPNDINTMKPCACIFNS